MSEKSDGITESKGFDGSVDTLLDTKGLNCPMPLLKAKQALNRMDVGQILEVIATDQGSVRDFQVFAAQSGNELLGQM
ncbi:MAG: sulfurtransferase TusA family protein [Gammaproteobacteria bacterium]|nr:sulfurtransferase TusA family protein [Gammaproteobacteria bacterium]